MNITLDFRTVFHAVRNPLLIWCAAIALAAVSGQPGVICITPAAWMLAAQAGRQCVLASHTGSRLVRIGEAGLAGALLGLAQALLFAVVIVLWIDLTPDDLRRIYQLTGLLIGVGMLVCAALAALVGLLQQRRMTNVQGDWANRPTTQIYRRRFK
jgi:hypothetical protein